MFAGKGISNNIPQLTVRLVVRQIPLDNVRNSFSRVCNTSQTCFFVYWIAYVLAISFLL